MIRALLSLILVLAPLQSTTLKNTTIPKGTLMIAGGLAPPTIFSGTWAAGALGTTTTTVVTGNGGGQASINMPAGATGLAFCYVQTSTGNSATYADTASGTWTQSAYFFDADNFAIIGFYSANNPGNATDVGTLTLGTSAGGSGHKSQCTMGYATKLAASSPADVTTGGNASGSSANTATSASFTTTHAAEVVCQFAGSQFSQTWVVGTIGGLTPTLYAGGVSDIDGLIGVQCLVTSSTLSSQTGSITWTGGASDWNTSILSLHQ